MSFDILFIVSITSIIQSIFGTGVLLFGTPLLLILGYDFKYVLILLLPISLLINIFQLIGNRNEIDITFYKRLVVYSLPLVIICLYHSSSDIINTNFIVGIFLMIISFRNYIQFIDSFIKSLLKNESIYLMILGIIHGFTNLGGALLSGAIFSKKLSKEGKRATIAVCYFSMALIQLMTLMVTTDRIDFISFFNLYWFIGPGIFFIVEKYFYFRIDENKYTIYSNIFLLAIGLTLIMKTIFEY
tara:strand:- start:624 stop:1352 length:729 start_codon:yes stop_codon:yes gene_type:complete